MLDDLRRAGQGKRTGHLPPRTVRDLPRLSAEDLAAEAASRGLAAPVLDTAERRIESGALYVLTAKNVQGRWRTRPPRSTKPGGRWEPDGFVRAVAAEWLEPGHPVLPVMRQAFGDQAGG